MKGYNPSLVEHPGTPVQLLMGLLSIISWSIATLLGLTSLAFPASVAANPEEYLRVIMIAFLVMNCIAVYYLGAAVTRSTRFILAGGACQAAYFLFGTLFPRIFHAAPEAIVCLCATALMGVLAPLLFTDKDCSDRRAVAAGFFIGLGMASKANFIPLLLLALLVRRPRAILIALSSSALFLFLFLLPIIDKLKRVFNWLFSIITHEGRHGSGAAGFIEWAEIPDNVRRIASAEPLLVAAAIAVTAAILITNSSDRRKAAIVGAALGATILIVLKHYSIHYLMPAVAIAPAIIIWAISRFTRRQWPYMVAGAVAAIFGVAGIQHTASTFADLRALRTANETAINEVIARYQNPVVIGAYRAGYKPLAIVMGLAWSDMKFARLFSQTTDIFTYDTGLKKPWRAHSGPVEWSYFDQFAKAGRAILIVQSRHDKIQPQTAQTETLLDQGFGDTVERIILPPKDGDK